MRFIRALQVTMLVVALAGAGLTMSACEKKGPAQDAGEKLDKAKDKIDDAVNPKGPLEKAGRAVDRATGN